MSLVAKIRERLNKQRRVYVGMGHGMDEPEEAKALRAVLKLHPHGEVENFTVAGRPMRRCKACGPTTLNREWCDTVRTIARELGITPDAEAAKDRT